MTTQFDIINSIIDHMVIQGGHKVIITGNGVAETVTCQVQGYGSITLSDISIRVVRGGQEVLWKTFYLESVDDILDDIMSELFA